MRVPLLVVAIVLLLSLALTPFTSQAHPALETPAPPQDDALIAPPPPASTLASGSELRGPSQFLAGSVAVRLVLPESDGSAEPSTESWTPEEVAHVTGQAQAALDWWAAHLPQARLSFHLRVDIAPTAYEPITHGLADEGLWIADSLRRLGYDGASYFDQIYAAGDANRDAVGADWTTTIFVVDSSNHPTGYFADGRFAYAYINGPLMVVTSDAGAYGTNRLAPVVAHEFGHLFGALDQYAAARIACDRRSGYLNAPTTNSQYGGCGGRAPSIMLEPMGAYTGGQIDESAQAQLGYRDSDGDGLIDPLDTAPALALTEATGVASTGRPILAGSTYDEPFPSLYHQLVTLNTITRVEYRVNGGLWLPLAAQDGAFDEAAESFAAELPLYDGSYDVEVRATNSSGTLSPLAARHLSLSWLGPQPDYHPTVQAISDRPGLALSLEAAAGTTAVQVSEDPQFTGAIWQPFVASLPFTLTGADGAHTLYVRFKDQAGLDSLPFALPVTLDTDPPTGSAARDPHDPSQLILSAHDATTAVTEVEIQIGEAAPVWLPYEASLSLGAGSEQAPVWLRFRDEAGNTSSAIAASTGYQVALPLIIR
ncbi:MAG: hypothetical protein HGA45_22655 [Chloroflexales bacterium]|nr:hypothetical protein [Chloroflexales bacterium]